MAEPSWGDVTYWIEQVKCGNEDACQALWHEYFEKLCRLCSEKLRGQNQRVSDAEDIAASAFESFYHRATAGKFPNLKDRDELWGLLLTIATRKGLTLIQKSKRKNAVKAKSVEIRFFMPQTILETLRDSGSMRQRILRRR